MYKEHGRAPAINWAIKLWSIAALCLIYCAEAYGVQNLTLAWKAGSVSGVAGYALYYGTASRTYTNRIDVGTNTQATVSGLKEGVTYYFAVTDYNSAKVESVPTAEIVVLVPGIIALVPGSTPAASLGMKFPAAPGHWYGVEASVDLKSWTTIWQMGTATSNAWVNFQDSQSKAFRKRFYRLVSHLSSVSPPPPVFLSMAKTNGTMIFSWSAVAGKSYQVQYSSQAANPTWSNLGNPMTATNSIMTGSDAVTPALRSRFYRVAMLP